MGTSSIPVDLFNPGQVFACMGFLEAAEILLGDARAGFDWRDRAAVRFRLRAGPEDDTSNPFAVVLGFLAVATATARAPAIPGTFPDRQGDENALPVTLEAGGRSVELSHWADGSTRNSLKLYAGDRSALQITQDMLRGKREGPRTTEGLQTLWKGGQNTALAAGPFDVVTPLGGSFNFDARGAWTALDAGYSPNTQGHGIAASPVVHLLAAWGLEHARPDEYETRRVRYGAWAELLPPTLARPSLAGLAVASPVRRFLCVLALSGKNKVVTFAEEEVA